MRNRRTELENEFTITRGKAGGATDWEFGINMYTLLFFFFAKIFFLLFDTKTQATKQNQMGLHQTSAQHKDISSLICHSTVFKTDNQQGPTVKKKKC